MRRALCDSIPNQIGKSIELNETETKHLLSVLRLRTGDTIELLDGKGNRATATLLAKEKRAFAEIVEAPTQNTKLNALPIHLCMAIIKGDAMEWTVEKAVELGVKSFVPVETEFTVVKIQKKGADVFQERWQKIADQALKQSGRLERMQVYAPLTFEEVLQNHISPASRMLWLDESLAESAPRANYLGIVASAVAEKDSFLWVGPEGGFSAQEKSRLLQLTLSANGRIVGAITRVHLGSIILRAETAALLGVSLLAGEAYGKTGQ